MKTTVLLIDAGNTRVKWQIVERQIDGNLDVLEHGSGSTTQWLDPVTAPEAVALVLSQAERLGVQMAWVCHVLGAHFDEMLPNLLQPLRVERPCQGDSNLLRTCYQDPASLGLDRWMNCLAVARLTCAPLNVVVSFGTATTIDAVVQSACLPQQERLGVQPFTHLGGLIAPGVSTMLESLSQHGRQLPLAELDQSPWPTSTRSAIGSAVHAAQLQLVLQQVRLLDDQFKDLDLTLWLTGGYAQAVRWPDPWPGSIAIRVEQLPEGVFNGLQVAMESTT